MVQEVAIPVSLYGKTLAELALPKEYHLTALALKKGRPGEEQEIMPPPLDHPFEAGDKLVLMGRKPDLVNFARL